MMTMSPVKRGIVSVVAAVALVFGLVPAPALAADGGQARIAHTDAEVEALVNKLLGAGDYVEGEAVVCSLADSAPGSGLAALFAQSTGPDLLAGAEDLSAVTARQYAEATGEDLATGQDALSTQSADGGDAVKVSLVRGNGMGTEGLLRALLSDPRVLSAEPNYVMSLEGDELAGTASQLQPAPLGDLAGQADSPADLTGYQWSSQGAAASTPQYVNGVNPGAQVPGWNDPAALNCDEGCVVAIMDSGVDYTHPDLENVMYRFSDALQEQLGCGEFGYAPAREDKTDPKDGLGHGTHCAGVMAAEWNGFGVSGVANGAKVCAVSIARSMEDSTYSYDTVIKAYDFLIRAAKAGVDIRAVNRSLGAGITNNANAAMIQAAGEAGIVTCIASGNNSADFDASYDDISSCQNSPYVLRVNASSQQDERAWFSNFGRTFTDVFAPGAGILSTIPTYLESSLRYFPQADGAPLCRLTSFTTVPPDVYRVERDERWNEVLGKLPIERGDIGADGDGDSAKARIAAKAQERLELCIDVPAGSLDDARVQDLSVAFYLDGVECRDSRLDVQLADGTYLIADGTVQPEEEGSWNLSDNSLYGWAFAALHIADPAKLSQGLARVRDAQGRSCIRLRLAATLNKQTLQPGDHIDLDAYLDQIAIGATGNDGLLPYRYMNGTSMATPFVTGGAAVASSRVHGADPDVRAAQTVRLLKGSVRQADGYLGFCTQNGQLDLSLLDSPAGRVPVLESARVAGNAITVEGAYLGSAGTLSVGGVQVKPTSWSDSAITAPWPAGIASGAAPVTVKTAAGTASCRAFMLAAPQAAANGAGLYERALTPPGYGSVPTTMEAPGSLTATEDGTLFAAAADTDGRYCDSVRRLMRSDDQGESWTAIELPQQLKDVSLAAGGGKVYALGSTPADVATRIDYWHLYSYDVARNAFELLRTFDANDEDDTGAEVNQRSALAWAAGSLHIVDNYSGAYNEYSYMRVRGFDDDYLPCNAQLLEQEYPQYSFYDGPKVSAAGDSIYVCGLANSSMPGLDDHVFGLERVDVTAGGDIECTNLSGALSGLEDGISVDDICIAACDEGVFLVGRGLDGLAPAEAERTDTYFLAKGASLLSPYGKTLSRAPAFTPSALCTGGWLYAFGVSQFEDTPVFGRAAKVAIAPEPEPAPGPSPEPSPEPEPAPAYTPKKGETLVVGGFAYTVLTSKTVSVKLSASGKKSLASASVPAVVKLGKKTFKVTKVAAKGFASAKKLKKVTLGANVKSIGASAFATCAKLKSFTATSKGLARIGASAFRGCKNLTKLAMTKTTKLTKPGVKGSLKGSSVKTVDVKNSKKAAYRKYFTKANCGKKVSV